jgi:shikimate dehydrogenase
MSEINAKTFCVIGHPIGHTLSPTIHQIVYDRLRLDFKYKAVHVPPEHLSDFIRDARQTGCPGFNVTIPHKASMLSFLDEVDDAADRIGAVNTVQQKNGILKGFNTDVIGLMNALKRGGWLPRGRVICLGAGGAARAVIEAVGRMGAESLILFDVIRERADALVRDFQGRHGMKIKSGDIEADLADQLPEADLLINATPVGMWPNSGDSPIQQPELIGPNATIFDLVYKPLKTRLMRDAEARGCKTISGLGMLISQALAADEIWLDRNMPEGIFETIWKNCQKSI